MNQNKSKRISRDELYQQVWSMPLTKLATQYGISDRGLAKICQRLDIPTPGRGYWARKAAGKHVIQYQLPDPVSDIPNDVVITEYGGRPQPNTETQSSLSKTIEESSEFSIPERLTSPHPVIEEWLDEYKNRKQEEKDEKKRDPLGHRYGEIYIMSTLTSVDRRRHRILHVIFNELEKLGYEIKSECFDSAYLEYEGLRVDFTLREKLKQVRRALTEEEQSSYFYRDKPYIQELEPTGKLQFSIKTYIESGLRREWNETKTKSMEEHLPEIVALLTLAGPILVEKERQREEDHRRYQAEERQRYEREQALKKDQNQWQQFLEVAQAWQQADIARKFIAELEKNDDEFDHDVIGDRTMKEWLSWARDWVNKTDPINQKKNDIFDKIARVNNFSW